MILGLKKILLENWNSLYWLLFIATIYWSMSGYELEQGLRLMNLIDY
jgi:hypothetical protein